MQELDCLILHTPKFNNYYKPVGQFMWVNYMPLGLLGIADFLNRNGMTCRVVHQGVEKMERKSWQLEDSLRSMSAPVIALSLHWHYQAHDVVESCKKIREINPDSYIVIGGATASFFHDEIVRDFNCVDGVIRGDGEVPLFDLAKKVKASEKDLSGVPNLTWRIPVAGSSPIEHLTLLTRRCSLSYASPTWSFNRKVRIDLERLNPISQRFRSKTFSTAPSSSQKKDA